MLNNTQSVLFADDLNHSISAVNKSENQTKCQIHVRLSLFIYVCKRGISPNSFIFNTVSLVCMWSPNKCD